MGRQSVVVVVVEGGGARKRERRRLMKWIELEARDRDTQKKAAKSRRKGRRSKRNTSPPKEERIGGLTWSHGVSELVGTGGIRKPLIFIELLQMLVEGDTTLASCATLISLGSAYQCPYHPFRTTRTVSEVSVPVPPHPSWLHQILGTLLDAPFGARGANNHPSSCHVTFAFFSSPTSFNLFANPSTVNITRYYKIGNTTTSFKYHRGHKSAHCNSRHQQWWTADLLSLARSERMISKKMQFSREREKLGRPALAVYPISACFRTDHPSSVVVNRLIAAAVWGGG